MKSGIAQYLVPIALLVAFGGCSDETYRNKRSRAKSVGEIGQISEKNLARVVVRKGVGGEAKLGNTTVTVSAEALPDDAILTIRRLEQGAADNQLIAILVGGEELIEVSLIHADSGVSYSRSELLLPIEFAQEVETDGSVAEFKAKYVVVSESVDGDGEWTTLDVPHDQLVVQVASNKVRLVRAKVSEPRFTATIISVPAPSCETGLAGPPLLLAAASESCPAGTGTSIALPISADDVTESATRTWLSGEEQLKLAGIGVGANMNTQTYDGIGGVTEGIVDLAEDSQKLGGSPPSYFLNAANIPETATRKWLTNSERTAISGLGTISTQNADNIAVTGGAVSGATIKLGNNTATCNSGAAGSIRWSGTAFQGCDGTSWSDLGSKNVPPLFIRFSRGTQLRTATDSAKDTQCVTDFGSDYMAANALELATNSSHLDLDEAYTEAVLTVRGDTDPWGYLDLAVIHRWEGWNGNFSVACVHKKAPVRFTVGTIAYNDTTANKDALCVSELGSLYSAATIQDVAYRAGAGLENISTYYFNTYDNARSFFSPGVEWFTYRGGGTHRMACVRSN